MSDTKTFTVSDLDRQPAVVLDACDATGEVRIRRRNGREYILATPRRRRSTGAMRRTAGIQDKIHRTSS